MDQNVREEPPDIELIRPEQCVWVPVLDRKSQQWKLEPRVWDFGGQLVKHGVHETFLGDDGRTVYVLVLSANAGPGSKFDGSDEETANTVAYWLRLIHHFGGSSSPVILGGTPCDIATRRPR